MSEHFCNDECNDYESYCGAKCKGFFCARLMGHDGPHSACGHHDHDICVWYDKENVIVQPYIDAA